MTPDHQLMWLEEENEEISQQQHVAPATGAEAPEQENAQLNALEDELQRTRRELMDVRKELAAKVQSTGGVQMQCLRGGDPTADRFAGLALTQGHVMQPAAEPV